MRFSYHPHEIDERMSEDCLFLNVWTPTIDRTAKLPVLVWIIGGVYVNGKLLNQVAEALLNGC